MSSAVESAVSQDNLEIPLIDFANYLHGDNALKQSTADAVLNGFRNAGFIYLKNHGISASTVSDIFRTSALFFAQPQDAKNALAWSTAEANRGYTAQGREKVTQIKDRADVDNLRTINPDLKESYEVGRDDQPELPNKWPAETDLRSFKEPVKAFFDACHAVNMQVMRCIALGMGLEEGYFDPFTDQGDNTLRLLHYPSVPRDVFVNNVGQVRAGEHSDYGSITLLFQDQRGGLQVLSPNNTYVDATPIPDTIVVNAGDLLARWSNDLIKSTKHRVVEPPSSSAPDTNGTASSETYPPRYSIAYFCNPNYDSFIDALPTTWEESGKKYPSVNSGEYITQRLTATYN